MEGLGLRLKRMRSRIERSPRPPPLPPPAEAGKVSSSPEESWSGLAELRPIGMMESVMRERKREMEDLRKMKMMMMSSC